MSVKKEKATRQRHGNWDDCPWNKPSIFLQKYQKSPVSWATAMVTAQIWIQKWSYS
jgi:hypothetical protein